MDKSKTYRTLKKQSDQYNHYDPSYAEKIYTNKYKKRTFFNNQTYTDVSQPRISSNKKIHIPNTKNNEVDLNENQDDQSDHQKDQKMNFINEDIYYPFSNEDSHKNFKSFVDKINCDKLMRIKYLPENIDYLNEDYNEYFCQLDLMEKVERYKIHRLFEKKFNLKIKNELCDINEVKSHEEFDNDSVVSPRKVSIEQDYEMDEDKSQEWEKQNKIYEKKQFDGFSKFYERQQFENVGYLEDSVKIEKFGEVGNFLANALTKNRRSSRYLKVEARRLHRSNSDITNDKVWRLRQFDKLGYNNHQIKYKYEIPDFNRVDFLVNQFKKSMKEENEYRRHRVFVHMKGGSVDSDDDHRSEEFNYLKSSLVSSFRNSVFVPSNTPKIKGGPFSSLRFMESFLKPQHFVKKEQNFAHQFNKSQGKYLRKKEEKPIKKQPNSHKPGNFKNKRYTSLWMTKIEKLLASKPDDIFQNDRDFEENRIKYAKKDRSEDVCINTAVGKLAHDLKKAFYVDTSRKSFIQVKTKPLSALEHTIMAMANKFEDNLQKTFMDVGYYETLKISKPKYKILNRTDRGIIRFVKKMELDQNLDNKRQFSTICQKCNTQKEIKQHD